MTPAQALRGIQIACSPMFPQAAVACSCVRIVHHEFPRDEEISIQTHLPLLLPIDGAYMLAKMACQFEMVKTQHQKLLSQT
jgi:hypothetical protein